MENRTRKTDVKDRKAEHNKQLLSRVTAKSLQKKINGKKKSIFLIIDFRQYRTASASYQISLIPPKDSSAATQCTETFKERCLAGQ